VSSDFYISRIQPYENLIAKICNAYCDTEEDYEDTFQEICYHIWRCKDNYRGDAKWSTWVYRLALNICLTTVNKKNAEKSRIEDSDYIYFLKQRQDESHDNYEMVTNLYSAIRKLSEIDRAVILLYLEKKSQIEISEIIGTTPNNVGVRVKRIKERLKRILNG